MRNSPSQLGGAVLLLLFRGAGDVQLVQLSLLHETWRALVAASSISLASACGESSLILLRLLSPQSLGAALRGPYFGMRMVRVISRSVSSLPQRASTPADCIIARLFFTVLRNSRTSRMR